MEYIFKAHPTKYNGVQFRSRLEARWAAFFDLAEVEWQYEPIDLVGWTPDFWIKLPPCSKKDCCATDELYVEVKPGKTPNECEQMAQPGFPGLGLSYPAPALFGLNPSITSWESPSCGGSSGGLTDLMNCCFLLKGSWNEAGNMTQWKPQRKDEPFQNNVGRFGIQFANEWGRTFIINRFALNRYFCRLDSMGMNELILTEEQMFSSKVKLYATKEQRDTVFDQHQHIMENKQKKRNEQITKLREIITEHEREQTK